MAVQNAHIPPQNFAIQDPSMAAQWQYGFTLPNQGMARNRGRYYDSAKYFGSMPQQTPRRNKVAVTSKTNLYVSGLSENDSDETLNQLVDGVISYKSCKAMMANGKCKGSGFIDCHSEEDAEKARLHINDISAKSGKKLSVKYAFENEKDVLNVYVRNLPRTDFTKEKLENLFKEYGQITSVKLLESNGTPTGTGFVRFSKADEAQHAVEAMNDRGKIVGDDGKPITCKLADKTDPRKKTSRNPGDDINGHCGAGGATNSYFAATPLTAGLQNGGGSTGTNGYLSAPGLLHAGPQNGGHHHPLVGGPAQHMNSVLASMQGLSLQNGAAGPNFSPVAAAAAAAAAAASNNAISPHMPLSGGGGAANGVVANGGVQVSAYNSAAGVQAPYFQAYPAPQPTAVSAGGYTHPSLQSSILMQGPPAAAQMYSPQYVYPGPAAYMGHTQASFLGQVPVSQAQAIQHQNGHQNQQLNAEANHYVPQHNYAMQ